jgi:acyl carrier protein
MDKSQIKIIMADALGVKHLNDSDSSDNVEEWDSLGHLSILSAIDNALDGKASDISELANADSVGKIIKILENNDFI